MTDGTVKFFNNMKNFGFITGDDGNDYFVHRNDVEGKQDLNEGDHVTFDGAEGDRGPKAENVKKA